MTFGLQQDDTVIFSCGVKKAVSKSSCTFQFTRYFRTYPLFRNNDEPKDFSSPVTHYAVCFC